MVTRKVIFLCEDYSIAFGMRNLRRYMSQNVAVYKEHDLDLYKNQWLYMHVLGREIAIDVVCARVFLLIWSNLYVNGEKRTCNIHYHGATSYYCVILSNLRRYEYGSGL